MNIRIALPINKNLLFRTLRAGEHFFAFFMNAYGN